MTNANARRPNRLEQAALEAIHREIAASPEQFFKQRLAMIETALEELIQEASAHHTELSQRIDQVSGTAARQAEVMAGKVGAIQDAVKELQILVFGKPEYHLEGLASEVRQMSQTLETMQVERQGFRGLIKLGLIVIGIIGVVTLVVVLVEVLSK